MQVPITCELAEKLIALSPLPLVETTARISEVDFTLWNHSPPHEKPLIMNGIKTGTWSAENSLIDEIRTFVQAGNKGIQTFFLTQLLHSKETIARTPPPDYTDNWNAVMPTLGCVRKYIDKHGLLMEVAGIKDAQYQAWQTFLWEQNITALWKGMVAVCTHFNQHLTEKQKP